MRILILYRHFWPDSPPYASMLRSIGAELLKEGHEVTIWCEQPCYKMSDRHAAAPRRESLDGIKVERFSRMLGWPSLAPVRLTDKLLFVPRLMVKAAIGKITGQKFDLVWTATIPPVLQGWCGRTIARLFGAKFIYHTQDLYPELAGHMGIWREGGFIYRLMEKIERKTRARADLLISLSDDMARTVTALAAPRKLAVINNFMLDDFTGAQQDGLAALPSPRNDGKIQLVFAGNLGIFQGLDQIVEAMRLVASKAPELELVLMGEGKALPALKKQAAGLGNVRFEPHRPFAEAQSVIAQADFGIVSLEPEIYRFAYPSKTLTYLGLGLPIFAIIEGESALAKMVEKQSLGFVSQGRGAQDIANALLKLATKADNIEQYRQNALQYYHQQLSRKVILERWAIEIAALEEPAKAALA